MIGILLLWDMIVNCISLNGNLMEWEEFPSIIQSTFKLTLLSQFMMGIRVELLPWNMVDFIAIIHIMGDDTIYS